MKRALRGLLLIVLVLIGAVTVAGLLYEPSTEIPAGFEGRHVRAGGLTLRVLDQGTGRDVLFIHGSPGALEDWEPVFERLRGDAHLVAFDRPNSGFSGVNGDYSLAGNADAALALIDVLGLKDVVVVGHSYGGSTALAMALRAPSVVQACVVVDSATYVPSREVTPLFRVLVLPGFGTGLARLLGPLSAEQRIAAGIREQFGDRQPPPGFIERRVKIWANPKVTRTIAAETIGMREFLAAQSPHYAEIRVPVRILAQADSQFRRETAERLHREVAGSTLRLVPGTGHYVQIEKPDAVVEEIRAALGRPSGR